jgi:hypothetical protein
MLAGRISAKMKMENLVIIEETDTIETLINKWGVDPKNSEWEIDTIGRLRNSDKKIVRMTNKIFLSNFEGNNPSKHGEMYRKISSEMDEKYVYVDCNFTEFTTPYSGVVSGCQVEKVGSYFVVTSNNKYFTDSTGIKAKALLWWSKSPIKIIVESYGDAANHSKGQIIFS